MTVMTVMTQSDDSDDSDDTKFVLHDDKTLIFTVSSTSIVLSPRRPPIIALVHEVTSLVVRF